MAARGTDPILSVTGHTENDRSGPPPTTHQLPLRAVPRVREHGSCHWPRHSGIHRKRRGVFRNCLYPIRREDLPSRCCGHCRRTVDRGSCCQAARPESRRKARCDGPSRSQYRLEDEAGAVGSLLVHLDDARRWFGGPARGLHQARRHDLYVSQPHCLHSVFSLNSQLWER